jgi:hypothetical protein
MADKLEELEKDWRGHLRHLPHLDEKMVEEQEKDWWGQLRHLPRLEFHPYPLQVLAKELAEKLASAKVKDLVYP